MEKIIKRVGFVATGDEIINGDIINTNVAHFAQQLKLHDIQPGKQITAADEEAEIRDAILYLAKDHDAIITIGGLGPTKDDLTRNALAAALELPLIFYPEPWQWIEDKFSALHLPLTENNRQQALLPKGSLPIHNPNGSACAAYLEHAGKDYFMLPGPPNECFPLFEKNVLPTLQEKNYIDKVFRKTWMLFGCSESRIADKLERIDYTGCELGYRVSYPYLEIKLKAKRESDLNKVVPLFEAALKNDLIGHDRQTGTEKLLALLKTKKKKLIVDDRATGGRLASLLYTPETTDSVSFLGMPTHLDTIPNITLTGLEDYWKQHTRDFFDLTLHIENETETLKIPSRKEKTLIYACELICLKLLRFYQV